MNASVTPVVEGSRITTPEELDEMRRRRKAAEKREQIETFKHSRADANTPLGRDFYFIPTREQFGALAPETVTKLIYLNTFNNLGGNRLMRTHKTPMYKGDLQDVLKLSRSTMYRFWKEVSPLYISENAEKVLISNRDVFKRGKLRKKETESYMKFWIKGTRALYEAADIKYHDKLGYLFKLFPYINIEWNILCYPEYVFETELDRIELLPLDEFCRLSGFDYTHVNTLKEYYREITFPVNGRNEMFCAITENTNRICINPHVLYSGSSFEKVEGFAALCRK